MNAKKCPRFFLRQNSNHNKYKYWRIQANLHVSIKGQQRSSLYYFRAFFLHSDFTPFLSKSFQIWDHFFLFFLLKDSEYLKSLDIGHWEGGAREPLNGVNKWKKNSSKTWTLTYFLHLFTSFKRLLAPFSQSPMSKLFRYSELLSNSIGKKWSRILKLLLKKGV